MTGDCIEREGEREKETFVEKRENNIPSVIILFDCYYSYRILLIYYYYYLTVSENDGSKIIFMMMTRRDRE